MSFIDNNVSGTVFMTSSRLNTVHAFTTRLGGVSTGIYASFNLGTNRGDAEKNVRKNYDILGKTLGFLPEKLVFSRQIHENTVRQVTSADSHTELFSPVPYDADGLVTDEVGLPLIIFTADCIPILLYDPVRHAIGAVHAGWRGTVADIAGEGVRAMIEKFGCSPQNIHAAIGPGIGKCCFETGSEVPQAVRLIETIDSASFITPGLREDKFMVDLKGINRALLEASGLLPQNIDVSPECTMCLHEKYWSHRYTHGARGAQASVIML